MHCKLWFKQEPNDKVPRLVRRLIPLVLVQGRHMKQKLFHRPSTQRTHNLKLTQICLFRAVVQFEEVQEALDKDIDASMVI